jgi:hypothetical protein
MNKEIINPMMPRGAGAISRDVTEVTLWYRLRMGHPGLQWKAYAWARYSQLFPVAEEHRTQVRRQLYFPRSASVRIPKWRCVTCDEGNSVAWDKCIKCHIPRDVNHELIALGMQHAVQTGEDPTIYDAWVRFVERRARVQDFLDHEMDIGERAKVRDANLPYLSYDGPIPARIEKMGRPKVAITQQALAFKTAHPIIMPRE